MLFSPMTMRESTDHSPGRSFCSIMSLNVLWTHWTSSSFHVLCIRFIQLTLKYIFTEDWFGDLHMNRCEDFLLNLKNKSVSSRFWLIHIEIFSFYSNLTHYMNANHFILGIETHSDFSQSNQSEYGGCFLSIKRLNLRWILPQVGGSDSKILPNDRVCVWFKELILNSL